MCPPTSSCALSGARSKRAPCKSYSASTRLTLSRARRWQVDPYFEVLIGKKTDPFCFSVIPSNDSVGELCYRADYGQQYYDVGGDSGALRFDLNSKTVVGNITSKIIHKDTNFWIVNKFPWYAAGVHQCICSQVREGGASGNKLMYPVNPNWTEQMFYIGREKIGIEYVQHREPRLLSRALI
jgi:hypothetical protein